MEVINKVLENILKVNMNQGKLSFIWISWLAVYVGMQEETWPVLSLIFHIYIDLTSGSNYPSTASASLHHFKNDPISLL